jgi:hypothetical protein
MPTLAACSAQTRHRRRRWARSAPAPREEAGPALPFSATARDYRLPRFYPPPRVHRYGPRSSRTSACRRFGSVSRSASGLLPCGCFGRNLTFLQGFNCGVIPCQPWFDLRRYIFCECCASSCFSVLAAIQAADPLYVCALARFSMAKFGRLEWYYPPVRKNCPRFV